MSTFDAIRAAVDAAEAADNAEFDAWQQTVAGLKQQATTQAATDAATIADLRAQIAALQPKPQPTAATRWGCNAAKNLAAKAKALGTVDVVRFFHGPGVAPHWPTDAELGAPLGSRALVYSSKAPPKDVAAGKYDAAYTALFAAAPVDRDNYVCLFHEPEDNIEAGEFTEADLLGAWQRIAPLARAAGAHIKLTVILMDWTANPKSGRNWRDYLPADFDVLAWDPYRWTPTNPADITHMFDAMIAAAGAVGKPWAIAEVGVDAATHTQAQRLQALTAVAHAAATATPAPLFVSYFDTVEGAHQWPISSDPAAVAAWKAGRAA